MKELESRLVYLFTGELYAAITFTFVYHYYSVNQHDRLSLSYVFYLLVFLLIQASFYWFVKWRKMKTRKAHLIRLSTYFSILKNVNIALIVTAPLIFLIEVMFLSFPSIFELGLILFIYIFAIIEYINYYHIQVTNYKGGRGRRSSIYKEINNKKSESSK